MIRLNSRSIKLLKYATAPGADLRCDAIADELGIHYQSVGRMLSRLRDSGLIEIKRGQHQRILKIEPTFNFQGGEYFFRNTR